MRARKDLGVVGLIHAAVLVTAQLLSDGCTFAPSDETYVGISSTSIGFSGFHLLANTTVHGQAWSPSTNQFVDVGTAVSDSSPFTTVDGYNLYAWNLSAVVPASQWIPSATGSYTRMRTISGSNTFMSVVQDPYSCFTAYPHLSDFQVHCASVHSPEFHLFTNDFIFGPASDRPVTPSYTANAHETSTAIAAPSATHPNGTEVVAFNQWDIPNAIVGWSFSQDGGQTWVRHSQLDPGYALGSPPGSETPSGGGSFGGFREDPCLPG